MMKNDWLVVADKRPDGDKRCFYCGQPVGHQHKMGCVTRRRTVVVDFTIRMVRQVPEDWQPEMVEFDMNDSSWCASSLLPELDRLDEAGCLCPNITGKYIREATEEDEESLGFKAPPE